LSVLGEKSPLAYIFARTCSVPYFFPLFHEHDDFFYITSAVMTLLSVIHSAAVLMRDVEIRVREAIRFSSLGMSYETLSSYN